MTMMMIDWGKPTGGAQSNVWPQQAKVVLLFGGLEVPIKLPVQIVGAHVDGCLLDGTEVNAEAQNALIILIRVCIVICCLRGFVLVQNTSDKQTLESVTLVACH